MSSLLSPWWERSPGCYQQEMHALEEAGYQPVRDERAFQEGVVRVLLKVPTEQFGELPLVVTYPDLYPYFRPDVAAPTLTFDDLKHHLAPFGGNLCLIGRGTERWFVSWTAAKVISEHLHLALSTGSSAEMPAEGIEQVQAEPFHTYLDYPPATVLVPASIRIDPSATAGIITVGLIEPVRLPPASFLRGILLQVGSSSGHVIAQADGTLERAVRGRVSGSWHRLNRPIVQEHAEAFLQELFDRVPEARLQPISEDGGGLGIRLWGVVYPDEVDHRQLGDAWMFVCQVSRHPPAQHSGHQPKKPRNQKRRRR